MHSAHQTCICVHTHEQLTYRAWQQHESCCQRLSLGNNTAICLQAAKSIGTVWMSSVLSYFLRKSFKVRHTYRSIDLSSQVLLVVT
jgi:hypothetical protein